jgi:hypothetical protein
MSGAPTINGTNQLPKPPINAGITKKKIIVIACPVIKTLYKWKLDCKNMEFGVANVIQIYNDSTVPAIPATPAKIKYKVPMSLWFVEKSHRVIKLNKTLFEKIIFILLIKKKTILIFNNILFFKITKIKL